MLPELHNFMEVYRLYIRPHFARPDEEALFVTNEGVGFREGTIGRRLTFFVENCGMNFAGRMAFVDMQKLITTEMLNRCSSEEQAILRRLLAHSEKTSCEWYTRPNLTTTGVQAVNIIQRLLDPQEKACFQVKTANGNPPVPAECAISDRSAPSKGSSSGIVPPSDASGPTYFTSMLKNEMKNSSMTTTSAKTFSIYKQQICICSSDTTTSNAKCNGWECDNFLRGYDRETFGTFC